MNELLKIKETMSSLQIAEITGKQHAHVMRDIRNMVDSIKKSNESTSGLVGSEYHRGDRTQYKFLSEHTQNILLNFATGENLPQYQITETFYIDTKGEKRAMYNLNKKACLLLASGYNVVLRAKIIDRWEELETEKHDGGFQVPQSFSEALQLAADQAKQIEDQQKQIEQKDKAIGKLQPKADFADAAFQAEGKVDIGQAAKILGLPFGRNTLFKKLKEAGVFFTNRNEPKQRYIKAGYFELSQLPPIKRANHPDLIVMKCTCTQKGLAYINTMFGGNPSDGKLAKIK